MGRGYLLRAPAPLASATEPACNLGWVQEATRMNALLGEMKISLEELKMGLDGALNFSPAMEGLSSAMATNKVLWQGADSGHWG